MIQADIEDELKPEDFGIELPVDTGRSRLGVKKGDTPPVSGYDPDDISTVDERVAAFREQYPDGVIETDPPTWHEATWSWVGSARVWKNRGDYNPAARADSTGSALENESEGRDYPAFETAESRALSRALRFLNVRPTPEGNDDDRDNT